MNIRRILRLVTIGPSSKRRKQDEARAPPSPHVIFFPDDSRWRRPALMHRPGPSLATALTGWWVASRPDCTRQTCGATSGSSSSPAAFCASTTGIAPSALEGPARRVAAWCRCDLVGPTACFVCTRTSPGSMPAGRRYPAAAV